MLSALTDAAGYRCCAKDLGTHLLWSPSRLSHHLDRMQRRELVRRVSCADGRGSDVVITECGLAAIEEAAPGHVEAVRQAFIDRIAPDDLAHLFRIAPRTREVVMALLSTRLE